MGAEVVIIKKLSVKYALEKDPPPCPSVAVNGRFIAKNDIVTFEALKTAILSENGGNGIMETPLLITLVSLGLGGGFLSGLLGLGGAIFMIPLLLYVPPLSAWGSST